MLIEGKPEKIEKTGSYTRTEEAQSIEGVGKEAQIKNI